MVLVESCACIMTEENIINNNIKNARLIMIIELLEYCFIKWFKIKHLA